MLSRLAESFYWIGRFVERSEATARLLAEHHQLIIEDKRVTPAAGAEVLLEALSLDAPDPPIADPAALIRVVLGNPEEPSTVSGSVHAARENARAIRDALSGEVFEALNSVDMRLTLAVGKADIRSPGVLLYGVLERLAVVHGVIDWTSPRDEGYLFLRLGRSLERIDMTARLLTMHHDAMWPESGPVAMLRATGALHAFLRGRNPMSGEQVRGFLVLDPLFPRSMLGSSRIAEDTVRALESQGSLDTSGRLLRTVGLLRSELEFSSSSPAPATVDEMAENGLLRASQAGLEVSEAFFRQVGTTVWSN
ncbi:MAG: Alpha-E protein [Actinomycetota bacterium]|nr:Alpha-E protein [Actinomycetota bacterium]